MELDASSATFDEKLVRLFVAFKKIVLAFDFLRRF